MSQRPQVVSVEAVDLVVEGRERLLLDGLHGDLARAAAQLREGRPALAAFLQHLPVLEMPDVGHRLLRHALDLALLLAPSGWTVRMLYILERRPTYSRILAGKVSSPSLPSSPITSTALARAAAESALSPSRGSWTCRPRRRGRRRSGSPRPWRGAGPAARRSAPSRSWCP